MVRCIRHIKVDRRVRRLVARHILVVNKNDVKEDRNKFDWMMNMFRNRVLAIVFSRAVCGGRDGSAFFDFLLGIFCCLFFSF